MKSFLQILLLAACAAIALFSIGCAAQIPGASFSAWTHDGNYGPVTTHYEAHNAVKQPDGKLVVGAYTGSVKILGGYGMADTISNLVIDGKSQPPVEVLPSAATKPDQK